MKGGRVKGQSTHWFLEEEDGQSADQWHVTQQRFHHHSQRPVKLDTEDKTSQTLEDDAASCPETSLTFSDPSASVGADLHPSRGGSNMLLRSGCRRTCFPGPLDVLGT